MLEKVAHGVLSDFDRGNAFALHLLHARVGIVDLDFQPGDQTAVGDRAVWAADDLRGEEKQLAGENLKTEEKGEE